MDEVKTGLALYKLDFRKTKIIWRCLRFYLRQDRKKLDYNTEDILIADV